LIDQDVVLLTKIQCALATMATVVTAPAPISQALLKAKRARALAAVGEARVANAWLRLGASAIVALVATSVLGNALPILWWLGLIPVVVVDRALYSSLHARCERHDPPENIGGLIAYTAAGSLYGNILAAMLWFAPYVHGETLAMMYVCGGLANAAASLRSWPTLSVAGMSPTIVFMLGLPLASFVLGGGQNALELIPMVAGLLFLGFGVNLWKSLLASDAAQLRAEEAAAREHRAAAAAAAAKSDTIRRMNDELRTPMTALIGAAEHLRRGATTPEARAHIATLAQAGEVLKVVLDDLSDLDRIDNGQLRIAPAPSDPRELLRGVVSAFQAAAHDKHLELFLDIAPEAPALVEIDAARVRQVLFNLLSNAVRYTAHGGVRVRLAVQAGSVQGRARLAFVVADTGAGLSRSHLALIFGQAGRNADGDGLGLAISFRLARLMGGNLSARSELGQGSVFSLTLEAPICARTRAA
jgi:signal transduction histidine kinase